MKRVQLSLAVAGAAVVAMVAGSMTAQSVSAAAPNTYQAPRGIEHLHTIVDLPPGVWTNTPLQVTLPVAGTYDLDADVRGRISGVPSVNTYISARLWNVTTNAVVPESERIVNQIIDHNVGDAITGSNQTAPISELIDVTGPTTILLQALRVDAVGSANVAQIYSDGVGRTSLRFQEIFP